MIPILFSPTATNFSTNGIGRLSDTISCTVHEARNGEFELEMEYPVDGTHYSDIVHSAVIVAKPSARRTPQAFRIYKITKPMQGTVTILAQHISYQLSWIPVKPFTAGTLANALAYFGTMSAEANPFTFSADFASDSDFAVAAPQSIRACLGGRAGSILDIYGGEWEFNNYSVILHRNRGADNGYEIRYGKNLVDLTQEQNIAETYTGILPYWQNEGTTVTLTAPVHAATAENFPFQRTAVVDLTEAFEGVPSEAQLQTYTEQFIARNSIGIPPVSLEIDFVNLPDTEEYKSLLAGSQNLDLCDTVTVIFQKLGVSVKSKVVDIVYDVLRERYTSIEVGSNRSTLAQTLEEQITMAEEAVTPGEMANKIDRATGVLNAGTRGHLIMNRNVSGWANELLALDNDNIAAAQNVLRINQNGIGFSSSGYQGPYHQAWTNDGHLSLGGINNQQGWLSILDANGVEIGRWNKDGIYANGGTFTGTITGTKIKGDGISTEDGEFFVHANDGEPVEMGFSGFFVEDEVMQTAWMGQTTNPATGGSTAGISGANGEAGFFKLYLLDGALVDVGAKLSDYGRRISALEQGSGDSNPTQGQGTGSGETLPGNGEGQVDPKERGTKWQILLSRR